MTSPDRPASALLDVIRSTGYWRVVIHPGTYTTDRVASLDPLCQAFEKARVELRGWDYPHGPRGGPSRHQGFIEGTAEWGSYVEVWRLATTGLFLHEFAMWEDTRDEIYKEPFKYLDVTGVLFRLTEIFLFAGRLTSALSFDSSVQVEFTIHRLGGRNLQTFDPRRVPLNDERKSAADLAAYSRKLTFPAVQLMGAAASIAVDETLKLYELFRWTPAREQVEADQQKLLSRRL